MYKNELDKACFQHDMNYGGFNDLSTRTALDKALRDKAFNIAKTPKYDVCQRGLASMIYKFFVDPLHLQTNHLQQLKSDLKKSIGININQNYQQKDKINI